MPGWNECSIYEDACRSKTCDHDTNKSRAAVKVAERIIDVTTDRGIPFRVVYGNRTYRDGTIADNPTVSFYDTRYDFGTHGQFVSDYDRDTVLRHRGGWALNLDGGIPDWIVDASAMYVVCTWLNHMTYQEEM